MPLPHVSIEGRVVADPDLRYAQSGTAVCKFRIVSSSKKKNEAGEWVDDKTLWMGVVGFNKLAENVAESIGKGDLVVVSGRLQTDEWTTEAGEKRSAPSLVADNVSASLLFRTVKHGGVERTKAAEPDAWATPDPSAPSTPPQQEEPPF